MWHGGSIELTRERLAVVVRLETAPASGGGETTAARPPWLDFRRAQAQSRATSGGGSLVGS
jgi:hypothetical protein